jgi:hypothetical protein
MTEKTNNNELQKNSIEKRIERQNDNNKLAYYSIKSNPKSPNKININVNALNRLLKYTSYNNLDDMINDKENSEEIIQKISSLYIAKNASRQGIKDEELQLKKINILQEYNIIILKDGKQKPIKGGGISKSKKKNINELKSIDFVIKYKNKEIGYITAKVTCGEGGHQDNVLNELLQFCDWASKQNKKKAFVVLYDNKNTSKRFNDIKAKYSKYKNLILTNTSNFKDDFLNWFNS